MPNDEMPQLIAVMTNSPHFVDINTPVHEAAELMKAHSIRHLPVMDGDTIESIICERDIARATTLGHALTEESALLVSDICPPRSYVADIADPLDKVLDVMATKHIGSVTIAKDGELAGIFTESDACRLLAGYLRDNCESLFAEDEDGSD